MNKVYTDNLLKFKDGSLKGKIDWGNNINKIVKFSYNGIQGEVKIVKYVKKKHGRIFILYNNIEYDMPAENFINCKLKHLFYKYVPESDLFKYWDWNKNNELNINPYRLNINDNKLKAWWKCEMDHSWQASSYNIINHKSWCPYCSNKKVQIGFNDIATKNPDLIQYFKYKEEAFNYTTGSNKKILAICPYCKNDKPIYINKLNRYGISCRYCGNGISYPEKFIGLLLNKLNIKYIREYSKYNAEWIVNNKRYDFYFELNKEKYIIETNGMQHYKDRFKTMNNNRSLYEEIENDKIKIEMAISGGIKKENYIIIDCRKSDFIFIRNSIENSLLSKIFNLNSINWDDIRCDLNKNIAKDVCEFYETNKDTMYMKDICKFFNLNSETIRKYLIEGNKFGWCNYICGIKKKQVICSNGIIFNSIKDSVKWLGIKSNANIIECCKNRRKTTKGYKWKYLDDYNKLSEKEKNDFLNTVTSRNSQGSFPNAKKNIVDVTIKQSEILNNTEE